MLRIYESLANEHDLIGLAGALVLCALAMLTTLGLLGKARHRGARSV